MKPRELFEHFTVFKSAMDSADVPQALKVQVAQEFKHSLPPAAFCAACPATRAWVEAAVQSVIDNLQAENARATQETPDTTGTPKAEAKGRKKG